MSIPKVSLQLRQNRERNKMKKIILGALCANLLYTNANLMAAASEGVATWAFVLMIGFALTYSLISTYALFHVQQVFPIAVFAVLDGFAVYTHLAPHGENFKVLVAAYFGIYTAYTLLIIYATRDAKSENGGGSTVDGHNAEYWHKCFLYQKDRADGNQTPINEIAETTPPPQPIAAASPTAALGAPRISDGNNEDEAKIMLSVKRAFARMTDSDKRRERIKDLPEKIKQQIIGMYQL